MNQLTLRQLQVLAAVKGGGSLAEIAKRLGMTRTGVYPIITRLAASGHVKLSPRVITAKGERALSSAVESLKVSLEKAQQSAA